MHRRDLKYGLFLFLTFAVYFLVMKWIGLYQIHLLRVFNVIFHSLFVYLAIREFQAHSSQSFGYLSGTLAGIKPSFIGVLLFALFQLFYLISDDPFMIHLQETSNFGDYLNPVSGAVIIFFEGMAVSLVISYIAMRFVDAQQIDEYEERL